MRGDFPEARRLLTSAIKDEDRQVYRGDDVMIVTLASLASEQVGATEEAQELLESAERIIERGRLNGVPDGVAQVEHPAQPADTRAGSGEAPGASRRQLGLTALTALVVGSLTSPPPVSAMLGEPT